MKMRLIRVIRNMRSFGSTETPVKPYGLTKIGVDEIEETARSNIDRYWTRIFARFTCSIWSSRPSATKAVSHTTQLLFLFNWDIGSLSCSSLGLHAG